MANANKANAILIADTKAITADDKADKNPRAETVVDAAAGTITLTIPGFAAKVVDVLKLADDVRTQGLFHGVKQKLVDSMALSRDTKTGRSASWADKHAAMSAMVDRLERGLWNERAEGGGPEGGLLRQALRNLWPTKDVADIDAFLKALSDDEEKALRVQAGPVKDEIDRIRASKVKGEVDVSALIARMGKL